MNGRRRDRGEWGDVAGVTLVLIVIAAVVADVMYTPKRVPRHFNDGAIVYHRCGGKLLVVRASVWHERSYVCRDATGRTDTYAEHELRAKPPVTAPPAVPAEEVPDGE